MPFVGMKLSPCLLASDDLVEPHCRAGEDGAAGKDGLGGLFRYNVGPASGRCCGEDSGEQHNHGPQGQQRLIVRLG